MKLIQKIQTNDQINPLCYIDKHTELEDTHKSSLMSLTSAKDFMFKNRGLNPVYTLVLCFNI